MSIKYCERKKLCPYQSLMCLLLILLVMLSHAPLALAHKVYVYAWYDGNKVHTESYFGSKKVKDGLIQVFDPSGHMLLEGRTNETGLFSFKPPQTSDLRIVVEAGLGHKNECTLKAEEFGDVVPTKTNTVKEKESTATSTPIGSDDIDQTRLIIEQVIDARLKLIMRELANIRKDKRPGINEIMGGIGYIFGFMGLILYFKSRKKDEQ